MILRLSAFRMAACGLLLILFGLAAADQPNQPPATSTATDKITVGARPLGRIAFIKDGGIWIMDTDGKNLQNICAVTNARGRLSFSPDNKIVAFSREGRDASKLPSDEGGAHLLHDIFLAYIDSAFTRPNWWYRVTFGLGGYYPEWAANDSIVYFQNDINANFVDYIVPSHQPARVNIKDGRTEYLRKDWQTITTSMIMPAVSRNGKKIAYVISYSPDPDRYVTRNYGIRILDLSDIMIPEEDLRKPSKGLENGIVPAWSPDGQYLAYLSNDIKNPGIYVVTADLSKTWLVYAPQGLKQIDPHPVSWSPDSKWLTFATTDGIVYVIDINGENLRPLTGTGKHSNPAWSH